MRYWLYVELQKPMEPKEPCRRRVPKRYSDIIIEYEICRVQARCLICVFVWAGRKEVVVLPDAEPIKK